MYGLLKRYGMRFYLNLKIRKGFVPLFMAKGLEKDLMKRGMLI